MQRIMQRLVIFSAAAVAVLSGAIASPASAQTFQNFTCADGARFTAAFLKYDPKQVHLQIDGKAVALKKRFTLTGARYTARGISLTMNRSGTILRHGRRGPTRCTAT
jgi:membrane-bound inhibitor of C-type lysozyme